MTAPGSEQRRGMREMADEATFDLFEVDRGYPELMVASVTGPRLAAMAEIAAYAVVYGQDGPVSIRERTHASEGEGDA